jgi:hypothetical protein
MGYGLSFARGLRLLLAALVLLEAPAQVAANPAHDGDGLAIRATAAGAALGSIFQRMEGEARDDGLWIASTLPEGGRLRLVSSAWGRSGRMQRLDTTGAVSIEGEIVRFVRPGVIEEYATGLDGVRQDFIVGRARWRACPPDARRLRSRALLWPPACERCRGAAPRCAAGSGLGAAPRDPCRRS